MRVIVTRPLEEARTWCERLRAAHVDAVPLPLIAIGDAPDAGRVGAAWQRMLSFRAVMFVSVNAVRGFFAARPEDSVLPMRAWAPGPGTGTALVDAGMPAQSVDMPGADAGRFDSEALWRAVRGQVEPGHRVLIVRGGDDDGNEKGRDWLGEQLRAAGAEVETVAAYVRVLPEWSEQQRQLARAATADGSLWLFSSSEGIANLERLVPGQAWQPARALATHPRIAQAARDAGFGLVRESRPALADVIAAIESFR